MGNKDKIYKALFAIQKELYEPGGYIEKSAINPVHKNKYIPLPKLLNTIVPLLQKHGCMLMQTNLPSLESGGANVQTTVIHVESGQSLSSNCTPPPMKQVGYEQTGTDDKGRAIKSQIHKITPQSYGGSITYARRYDLECFFAIPTEDDDANAASGVSRQAKPKQVSVIEALIKYCEKNGIKVGEEAAKKTLSDAGCKTEEQLKNLGCVKAYNIIKAATDGGNNE